MSDDKDTRRLEADKGVSFIQSSCVYRAKSETAQFAKCVLTHFWLKYAQIQAAIVPFVSLASALERGRAFIGELLSKKLTLFVRVYLWHVLAAKDSQSLWIRVTL